MRNIIFALAVLIVALAAFTDIALAEEEGRPYQEQMKALLDEARIGAAGTQEVIEYLEHEIELRKISFKEIGSSPEEFKELRERGCRNTISELVEDIKTLEVPINHILELEETLLECNFTYEQVGMRQSEIADLEKLGYAVLATESLRDYEKIGNPVYIHRYTRFLQWGGLTEENLGLSEEETRRILADK